jgi:endonuclease YncB( thermonuclease family)
MWDWLRRALGLPERTFEVPAGAARVQDGDSFVVGDRRLRLAGMDAPEMGQPTRGKPPEDAGRLAAAALREMVRGRALRVRPLGQDAFGRTVAAVSAEGVGDLTIAMLAGGWGVPLPSADPAARRAHADAVRAGRGVWGLGGIVEPQIWRAQKRAFAVVEAKLAR